ncbi:MAG: LacI family transcriptional regulator [Butyrivibrio sp.]|nr:LacI family transcriptional regulator [Butyrivibrio sp.]
MGTKLTIDDIAEALGVSKTTVSRAISGKGRIGRETRGRVQEYIQAHNYKPNVIAKGLAQQRTYNIVVAWPGDPGIVELPFFQNCLIGMSQAAEDAGYDILVSVADSKDISKLQRIVENHKVDGAVLTRTLVRDPLAAYLKESGLPFVAIGSTEDPEVLQIDNDHYAACRELTSVLLAKGIRKLALIGGEDNLVITQTRRSGFLAAFEDAKIQPDRSLIFTGTDGQAEVTDMVDEILEKKADGVICMDDFFAGNVMEVCKSRKIRIPEDLKLASFYDSSVLDYASPAVTSLNFNDRRLGAAAIRMLLDKIEGKEVKNIRLKTYEVMLRESTK